MRAWKWTTFDLLIVVVHGIRLEIYLCLQSLWRELAHVLLLEMTANGIFSCSCKSVKPNSLPTTTHVPNLVAQPAHALFIHIPCMFIFYYKYMVIWLCLSMPWNINVNSIPTKPRESKQISQNLQLRRKDPNQFGYQKQLDCFQCVHGKGTTFNTWIVVVQGIWLKIYPYSQSLWRQMAHVLLLEMTSKGIH